MSISKPVSLTELVRTGKWKSQLRRYLDSCRFPSDADTKRPGGRLPNLAGFCRWLGCGVSELDALRTAHPEVADYLCAVMEDEALNASSVSPTLLTAYLKRRLGYAEKPDASSAECGDVRVIFEHDITEDGA